MPNPNLFQLYSDNNKLGESADGIFELSSTQLPFISTIRCIPHNIYWRGQEAELNLTVYGKLSFINACENTLFYLFCYHFIEGVSKELCHYNEDLWTELLKSNLENVGRMFIVSEYHPYLKTEQKYQIQS